MNRQARLIFRGDGPNDGLLIGVTLKGQTMFEPNTVYELSEILGEISIKKLGRSVIGTMEEGKDNWPIPRINAAQDIGTLLSENEGGYLWLSREEYELIKAQRAVAPD